MARWLDKLLPKPDRRPSWLRGAIQAGSLYRMSDVRGNSSFSDIQTHIQTMRALAKDSQISTALAYYATDATTLNTSGQIIWATANDKKYDEAAKVINTLFRTWNFRASYSR